MELVILGTLFVVGWVAVAAIGSQAYFLGEQSKPIHERNWKSAGFHRLASILTGKQVNYQERASSYRAEKSLTRLMGQG
ncbi:MAG: hypothetical protein NW237_13370 [Cyanobacteriota bacterium]|nr:hypothetical protein [Cyanobacteriota bacterium]